MDNNHDELNNAPNASQSEVQEAPDKDHAPLYVYQRIRKEGVGYSRRDKAKSQPDNSQPKSHLSFSLPKIEKTEYGKFTLSAVAVMLMIVNFIALGRTAANLLYVFSEKLLYLLHIDCLYFETFTFTNIRVITTYILSFVFGGFIVYLLLRILSIFCEKGIIYPCGHVLRLILALFIVIFAIITLIKLLAGHSLYSINALNSMAPLCIYLCSVIICLFSKINILND